MILVNRSGEWMAAEELHAELLALESASVPVLDLDGIDYLDAACLQVIIAFQKNGNQAAAMECRNLSSALGGWLRCAGAAEYLRESRAETSEVA